MNVEKPDEDGADPPAGVAASSGQAREKSAKLRKLQALLEDPEVADDEILMQTVQARIKALEVKPIASDAMQIQK
eukprot:2974845-Alexandrium_andersonii.AAC.1